MDNLGLIDIHSLNGDYLIIGDHLKIQQSRMAMMYLRRNLKHEITPKGVLVKATMDVDSIMRHIKVLAKYAKCSLRFSKDVDDDILDYENREKQFLLFSSKANDIRNNHPVVADFEHFKEVLIKALPNRRLYPLQMLSAYHMAFAQNSCNFSVPGAGKTSVVYGAYSYLKSLPTDNPKHVDKLLIIGPLSSFGPWENEYQECFGIPVESMRLIGGVSKNFKSQYLHSLETTELTLTSYQSVVSIKDDLKFFLERNKVMVVLDEAHKIKNTQGAITASSTLELAKTAKSRIVLTGTPAPNGYEDLYNLFKFIWPDRNIISFNVAQLENMSKTTDDCRVNDLIDQISPFFIRVRKSDLHIPPFTVTEIQIPMSPSQRHIYDVIEKKVMDAITNEDDSPYLRKIRQAKMIRLMQVATNPELLNYSLNTITDDQGCFYTESEEDKQFIKSIKKFIKDEIPNKFVYAADIAEKIVNEGGKVIIWANYIRNIEKFNDYLEARGIASRTLYGATPVEGGDANSESEVLTREAIVREFNSDSSSFNVIIANPFAVAESISLHKKCHNAIYMERSFNAAHFIQSKDRIHRYGLAEGIITNYYYLISTDSIDNTINSRLKIKEDRLNKIMESMPIPLFDNVSETGGIDDIKAILQDYATRSQKL